MKIVRRSNQNFVTSEFLPYSKLIEPVVINLLKNQHFGLCLCIRENLLNEELDRLCRLYTKAGIPLIFWPLLPEQEGLYLNKYSITEYYQYLDTVFDWLESRGHHIFGLLVDVEPDYQKPKPGSSPIIDNIWNSIRDMDEADFKEAITGFRQIIAKIRKHGCQAIGAALPFVCNDKLEHSEVWQDYWGGPVAMVEWDVLVFMLFGSWFVQMGLSWPNAHYLIYDYTEAIRKFWPNKAVVALGVTTPGTGAEKDLYQSPAQLSEGVSAVKAAGISNIAIYDLKGILDSPNPAAWLKKVQVAKPLIPGTDKKSSVDYSRPIIDPFQVRVYKTIVRLLGKLLETVRFMKNTGKRFLPYWVTGETNRSNPHV